VNVIARGSSRTVELKWEASPGPNRPRGYEVLRGDTVVAKASGTSAKEAGLDNGLEYCFTVRAVDATGQRSPPTAPACAYAWERDKPPAPTQLEARALSVTEIAIAWKPLPKVMAAGGYEVRGGSSPIFATEPSARATGLAPGKRHCFTIFSLSPERKRGFPSEAVCAETPPDVTPPTTPGSLTAVALPGKIQLRWSASTDDAGVAAYEILQDGALAGTVVELFALVSELTAGEHCYAVRAVDGSGNRSTPSPQACARPPDLTPPTRPTSVTATAAKQTEVSIRWNPATDDVGVARYEVLRDGKVIARRTTTEAREVGLEALARYCYVVVAVDAAGNRSPASEAACTTTPDQTPPSRPGDLVASVNGDRVDLRWGPSTDDVGVVAYEVLRGTAKVARVPAEERAWADVGPKPEAESCYVVRALDAAGNVSPASMHACVKTPDRTPPSAPEGLVAAPGSSTRVSLSWAPSSDNVGVAGYEVLRDGQVIAQPIGTSTSVGGLQPRQEGCYAVRAFDVAGNRSRPSAIACARATEEDALPAPAGLEVTRAGADEVRVRWDPIPGADVTYLVYWDATRVSGGASMKARTLGSTKLTTFKVFGPPARERRCYRVVARVGNQDSAETLPACVDAAPK
jgi:chitodextrinase